MAAPLVLFTEPAPRTPVGILPGVGTVSADGQARYERAVADTIGLGVWCDTFARWWPYPCGDPRQMLRCIEGGPIVSCPACGGHAELVDAIEDEPLTLEWDPGVGPLVVDTVGL